MAIQSFYFIFRCCRCYFQPFVQNTTFLFDLLLARRSTSESWQTHTHTHKSSKLAQCSLLIIPYSPFVSVCTENALTRPYRKSSIFTSIARGEIGKAFGKWLLWFGHRTRRINGHPRTLARPPKLPQIQFAYSFANELQMESSRTRRFHFLYFGVARRCLVSHLYLCQCVCVCVLLIWSDRNSVENAFSGNFIDKSHPSKTVEVKLVEAV